MERMCGWRAPSRTPHRPAPRGDGAGAASIDSAGIEGDALGPKRGETLGDDVGIYELLHGQGAGEDVRSGRGFASAVGAGDDYEVGTWGGLFVGRLSIVTRGFFESFTEPRPSGSGQHRRTAHNAKMSHICIAGLSSFSRPPYPWPRRPTFAPSKRSSPKRITTSSRAANWRMPAWRSRRSFARWGCPAPSCNKPSRRKPPTPCATRSTNSCWSRKPRTSTSTWIPKSPSAWPPCRSKAKSPIRTNSTTSPGDKMGFPLEDKKDQPKKAPLPQPVIGGGVTNGSAVP